MADRVLLISWGSPVPGREERGLEVFNEAIGLHGRLVWRLQGAAGRTAPRTMGTARKAGAAIRRHGGRSTEVAAQD